MRFNVIAILRQLVFSLCLAAAAAGGAGAEVITFNGCRDANGVPVKAAPNPDLPSVAQARMAPNIWGGTNPAVEYNPEVLPWLAPQTRLFFYAHECAHHALGHSLGAAFPPAQEKAADCAAANMLKDAGLLRDPDIAVVQKDLANVPKGDWKSLPGPARAINLRKCTGKPAVAGEAAAGAAR